MRIIIDVDCTTADYVGAVLAIQSKFAGKTISRENLILPWDWYETSTEDERAFIRQTMDSMEFWKTLPLVKNAKEGIEYLRSQGHLLIWATKPRESCVGWVDARREWINTNFQFEEHKEPFIPSGDKWLIQASAIIDDYLPYVEAWEKHNRNGIGFVFGSELNVTYQGPRYNWNDIMTMSFFRNKEIDRCSSANTPVK